MIKRERRFLESEVTVQQGEVATISGYCAVFNKRSHDLGNFVEEVDPHAFDECLANNPDVVGLYNHSNDMVLGRTTSGTMRLSVDEVGLKYEIDAPETSYAKDLVVSMRRGDVRSSSFGFFCEADDWSWDRVSKQNVRRLKKVSIFDASVVTSSAYPDATSQVRALFPDSKGEIPEEIRTNIAELRGKTLKEKRGRNILAAVAGAKWAIHPDKLETICAFLTAWSEGHSVTKEDVRIGMMGFDQDGMGSSFESADDKSDAGVAVINVFGTISHRMTLMSEFCGGASCESITNNFRAALNDDAVKAIVFDIDSPGGTVTGVPELAAEILAARGQKPIVAVANGMAASAAYWLASAADKFFVTPSGDVGSIGVYTVHQDVSAAMDKAGVKITFIQAGKYKTEGNPYEPASESFLADQQKGVDEYYDMFIDAVAAGRGVTSEVAKADFGQGRMLSAKDALAVGMVDGIQTLDQVVAGLLTDISVASYTTAPLVSEQASSIRVDAMNDTCDCMCDECLAGNHPGCTMEDGCDWEDDDNEEDDDEVIKSPTEAPVAEVAEVPAEVAEAAVETSGGLSQEEIEANLNTALKVKLMSLL